MLIGLPDLAKKKVIENRDKSKITKYFFFFCFCQRETLYIFFTNLINSKLISELVSRDKFFSCVVMQHMYDEI